MTLCIDARMIEHAGIGVYLRNLLPFLEGNITLLIKKADWERYPKLHQFTPIFCTSPIYSLKEQWEIPKKLPQIDLFWTPHFNAPLLPVRAKKRIITIHDLYHLDHLETLSLPQKFYAKLVIGQAVKNADKIIVISAFTKQRLLHWFPSLESKIKVIPLGPGNSCLKKTTPLKRKRPYFLFVGSIKPHKNILLLLTAFEELIKWQKEPYDLILNGKMTGLRTTFDLPEYLASRPSLLRRVHLIQTGPEELAEQYSGAKALIFPSKYEGWGFPPLEAMRLGCPVIASNAASIPEACGKAPLYFNPEKAEELTSHMSAISKNPELCKRLIERGYEHVKTLSWKECAENHYQTFKVLSAYSLTSTAQSI